MQGKSLAEQLNRKADRFYKKMAGTSAVFIDAAFDVASPVERDGLVWSGGELGLESDPRNLCWKPVLENTLALEGLEDYDPPEDGDARFVSSQGVAFVYIQAKRAWVQLTQGY
ncbi:MAG: hypothetical protein KDI30_06905 [Pseudomonadales bacterium]|nr:hypothetical protein [Pseudomonadales bacterium]